MAIRHLVHDLKAIAHINGMGDQPLIWKVRKRFVEAEKRAYLADAARRRQEEEADEQKRLEEATVAAQSAVADEPQGERRAA